MSEKCSLLGRAPGEPHGPQRLQGPARDWLHPSLVPKLHLSQRNGAGSCWPWGCPSSGWQLQCSEGHGHPRRMGSFPGLRFRTTFKPTLHGEEWVCWSWGLERTPSLALAQTPANPLPGEVAELILLLPRGLWEVPKRSCRAPRSPPGGPQLSPAASERAPHMVSPATCNWGNALYQYELF